MDKKKRFELDPERLSTTDEAGHRVYLYPEDVSGVWKNRRRIFYWFLLFIYLVLPWFYINGKPFLMLNIFTREFTFMGNTLHGVEPILFFLVAASGLFFIGFLTSIFGRVWCGWACPQTVFIQTIFSSIETLVEGKARARKALDEGTWNLNKVSRKFIKWTLFTIISLHITHTFIGYFVGPRELLAMSMKSPAENMGIFLSMLIATSVILVDFGWFREQFCIIACPYGRMQSVLMDENSLVIAYDDSRGEPRRGLVPRSEEGDCINCYACVKVCPTGIDIRRGTQLECIACTQCIDACDDIMVKVNKPKGLIKYSSENALKGITGGKKLRSYIYLTISIALISGIFLFLNQSTKLSFVFMRGTDTPFQMSQELVLNHFTLKITHQGSTQYDLYFEVADPELAKSVQLITPMKPLKMKGHNIKTTLFFKFSPAILINGTKIIKMNVLDQDKNILSIQEVVLVGPTH